jgi:hypothetical protein
MNNKDFIFYGIVIFILGIMLYQNIQISSRLSDIENRDRATKVATPDSFNYVMDRFKLYNENTDTNTVLLFIKSVDYYSLNKKDVFDLLVGQIILESRAIHTYPKGHALAGSVIMGVSGSVGICQIMPSTGLNYLENMSDDDYSLYDLGVSDYSFVNDKSLSKEAKLNMVIKWLSRIENNFALWGFIMHEGLKHNGTLEAFVIYNAGKGGMLGYISENKTICSHKYIVGIRKTIKYLNDIILT